MQSSLLVTTPGDRKKKKHVNIANCFAPLFAHVITGSYKRRHRSPLRVRHVCLQSLQPEFFYPRKSEETSVHRQSVGFSCQVCGQHFYRKDHLGSHMKVHRLVVVVRRDLLGISVDVTVDSLPPPPPPLPAPPPERHDETPVCDFCTKSFASRKTLKRKTDHSSSIWRLFLSSARPTLLSKGPTQEASHQ